MLEKFKIVDVQLHQGAGAIVPGYGMVPLDSELLTDEIAEAAVAAGSPFFVGVEAGLGKKNDVKPLNNNTDGKTVTK
jgi:acetyl/propionyl-CoA carboxylase alpha subunit